MGNRRGGGGNPSSPPAALVGWATRPEQMILEGTLGDIASRARAAGLEPPAVLIAGGVVRLPRRLDRRPPGPLRGRTGVETRPPDQSGFSVEAPCHPRRRG